MCVYVREREREREGERQTDRQTETDRQIDRQTETDMSGNVYLFIIKRLPDTFRGSIHNLRQFVHIVSIVHRCSS